MGIKQVIEMEFEEINKRNKRQYDSSDSENERIPNLLILRSSQSAESIRA